MSDLLRRIVLTRASIAVVASLLLAPTGVSGTGRDPAPLSNAIVLVMRHAEKPSDGSELAPAGVARAKAYVRYFQRYKVDGKPLHLDHIFATADGKNSMRERLTVEPLAKALGLSVDLRYKNKAFGELAADVHGHSYGHELLICWHHGNIPGLVAALGGNSKKLIAGGKWPDDHFDWIVELHYDATGHIIPDKTKLVHEHLMPGDAP